MLWYVWLWVWFPTNPWEYVICKSVDRKDPPAMLTGVTPEVNLRMRKYANWDLLWLCNPGQISPEAQAPQPIPMFSNIFFFNSKNYDNTNIRVIACKETYFLFGGSNPHWNFPANPCYPKHAFCVALIEIFDFYSHVGWMWFMQIWQWMCFIRWSNSRFLCKYLEFESIFRLVNSWRPYLSSFLNTTVVYNKTNLETWINEMK